MHAILPHEARNSLFDLLLWSQLVCVSTLLLAAVGCTRVQPGIASADANPSLVVLTMGKHLNFDCTVTGANGSFQNGD